MARLLGRDTLSLLLAVIAPFAAAAALVPWRNSVTSSNAALILVVVVVAVAAIGNRIAGAVAALSAAVWFDFFLTAPFQPFAITDRADVETFWVPRPGSSVTVLSSGAGARGTWITVTSRTRPWSFAHTAMAPTTGGS